MTTLKVTHFKVLKFSSTNNFADLKVNHRKKIQTLMNNYLFVQHYRPTFQDRCAPPNLVYFSWIELS